MKTAQGDLVFRQGNVRLDPNARVLYVNGQLAKLGGRAYDLLEALVERRDRLVPKQELMDVVWPGLFVEENNLQVHVMHLRKLLGPEAVVTVTGRGYRFALVPDDNGTARNEADSLAFATQPHRLPTLSTQLIGRETLTESICALMRRSDVRLVTLTGPGGSGKTRVGLHVTGELAHDFADGSYIVMLAPVRDPAYVASAIAMALNLQEAGNRPAEELIIGYLRDRETLLTLDNFEHLTSASQLITKLLDACVRLKVLVTSRAVLKLSAEHDVVVPPLALPDSQATTHRVSGSAAVRLFVERARAAAYEVGVSDSEMAVAAQICRRLDGLPLAIELAAARLRVLSPQALLVRLEHRLQLLKSGSSDLPERQRTLRSAISWSYELLEPSEQAVFRRLSVFVGGWSLDAAESVAGSEGSADGVLDLVAAVVDQNLAQRIEDVNGEPRFTMLETVREYAHEQLESSGEMIRIRQRHAEYFTNLAEKVEPFLMSSRRKQWLDQLQAEMNNARVALAWLIHDRADANGGLRLAGALPWMWYFAGQFSEGRSWLKSALNLPRATKHPAAMAKVLTGSARLALYAGDAGEAVDLARRSVELWRTTDDRRGLAFGLFHLGLPLTLVGGRDEARSAMQESLYCFRELDDAWGIGLATTYLGVVLSYTPGAEGESRPLLVEGRARFGALGDNWAVTTSSHYLGSIAFRQGDYAGAREWTEDMLKVARDLNDGYRIARNLHQLAEIAFAERSYPEATDHLKASLALNREQGRIGDGAQQLRLLARMEQLGQRSDRTVRLFAAASLLAERDRTLPHDDPDINQSALADARRSLGERRYEHEWAMGVAMSFDEAVSWALSGDLDTC